MGVVLTPVGETAMIEILSCSGDDILVILDC